MKGTKDNIQTQLGTLEQKKNDLESLISSSKSFIVTAIKDKDPSLALTENSTTDEICAAIRGIETGVSTDDATATASVIYDGYVAYAKGQRLIGTYHPIFKSANWAYLWLRQNCPNVVVIPILCPKSVGKITFILRSPGELYIGAAASISFTCFSDIAIDCKDRVYLTKTSLTTYSDYTNVSNDIVSTLAISRTPVSYAINDPPYCDVAELSTVQSGIKVISVAGGTNGAVNNRGTFYNLLIVSV